MTAIFVDGKGEKVV